MYNDRIDGCIAMECDNDHGHHLHTTENELQKVPLIIVQYPDNVPISHGVCACQVFDTKQEIPITINNDSFIVGIFLLVFHQGLCLCDKHFVCHREIGTFVILCAVLYVHRLKTTSKDIFFIQKFNSFYFCFVFPTYMSFMTHSI
jgi:hypothetical protein